MVTEENPDIDNNSIARTYKAELILLFVTLTWGLSFPLIKISLQFISPLFFVFMRFIITFILFCLFFRRKLNFSKFNDWKYGLVLGVFIFAGFAFQTLGLKHTTASKSAFITGTNLIVIPFAQYFIIKTKPKPENIAGAVIVLIGLYILSEAYFSSPNIGDTFTLLCALAFALHIVLLNKYSEKINFYYLVFGQFLAMSFLSLLFMLFFEVLIDRDLFINLNIKLILALAYTSIFSTFISIILMTKYQNETTPLRAGIIYNLESVFAVFFAYLLLNEVLNLSQILGAVIMISGLLISEFYGFAKIKFTNGKRI